MTRASLLRILTFCTTFVFVFFSLWASEAWLGSRSITSSNQVLAAETSTNIALLPYPSISPHQALPYINARYFALYNVESGKFILDHSGDQQVPIASTTKLMTALLVEKYGKPTDVVQASSFAVEQDGSVMGLRPGEKMTVENVLYGLLLPSGNDAAHTLAEYIGRILLNSQSATPEEATQKFVAEMNIEAALLHMNDTAYQDPAGLNDTGHSSAKDLAKLASVLLQDPVLHKISTTATYTVKDVTGTISHDLKESNRLVTDYNYPGAGLGKTGFTPAAGHCLVASASRANVTYVAVILSTFNLTPEASAQEARKLLDWGFNSVQYL